MEMAPSGFQPAYMTSEEWLAGLFALRSAYPLVIIYQDFAVHLFNFPCAAVNGISNSAYFTGCSRILDSMRSLSHLPHYDAIIDLLTIIIRCYGQTTDITSMEKDLTSAYPTCMITNLITSFLLKSSLLMLPPSKVMMMI